MKEKRKKSGTACNLCRHQKKRCEGGKVGEESCKRCSRKGCCSYLTNSSDGKQIAFLDLSFYGDLLHLKTLGSGISSNPSHNDVSQLQTNMSTEFLNAGDISQMPSDFDIFDETPEVTNVNGDILQMQPNFDESPELISVFDAQQFQSGFNLTELSNVNGYQYEIYPEYVNSFHKTNIHQVSQVRQQLSRLDLILSDNQVMQSQMSPLLNDRLDSLYTTLDSYSSYFNQSLGELEESNLHSSRNTNALQDRIDQYIALVPGIASSI
ncbi:11078_t:CDS:2, partial [Gigaspora rosea]